MNTLFPELESDTSYYACCPQMTTKYQPWIHDDQIAGFYEQFGNLTFLTVKVTISACLSVCHRTVVVLFSFSSYGCIVVK